MINFDYASHTPADERVLAEFCRVERHFPGNALAAHSAGRAAAAEMARAARGIADLLGVKPQEIIFTSGASEANNLAIKGIAKAYRHVGKHILSTCLEHPSVSGTLVALQLSGCEIELLKILPDGKIDLEHMRAAIRRDTVLICVSAVDSELGAVQPVAEILELLKGHPHCHLHVDAAQAVGKVPFYFKWHADTNSPPRRGARRAGWLHGNALHYGEASPTNHPVAPRHPSKEGNYQRPSTFCFSPHKFHGLCGVGVLVKREDVVLEPLIHGGAGSSIYRSGTPAPALAASAYMALEIAQREMEPRLQAVRELRRRVIEGVKNIAVINSPPDGSPYILNISVPGIKGSDFQAELDRRGICVSVKSACSTDNAPSRAVMAVSRDKKIAQSSWRISFCHNQLVTESDQLVFAIEEIASSLRA